jgi:hypothetical protein
MSDVPRPEWRKSSYCSHDSCVEVALLGSRILIRDSKTKDGPILAFQQAEWAEFLEGARQGEFSFSPRTP